MQSVLPAQQMHSSCVRPVKPAHPCRRAQRASTIAVRLMMLATPAATGRHNSQHVIIRPTEHCVVACLQQHSTAKHAQCTTMHLNWTGSSLYQQQPKPCSETSSSGHLPRLSLQMKDGSVHLATCLAAVTMTLPLPDTPAATQWQGSAQTLNRFAGHVSNPCCTHRCQSKTTHTSQHKHISNAEERLVQISWQQHRPLT